MKNKSWTLINPDGTESIMNYDPFEKQMADKKQIELWHNMVVTGLVRGLTHTIQDGRNNDIDWVRKRGNLFEAFSRCIYSLIYNQNFEYDEKELKEVSEEGYKRCI